MLYEVITNKGIGGTVEPAADDEEICSLRFGAAEQERLWVQTASDHSCVQFSDKAESRNQLW